MKMNKNTILKTLDPERCRKEVKKYIRRFTSLKDRDYFESMLNELIENNSIPLELLSYFPIRSSIAGKTRFDQLYDMCMSLTFPGYRNETLEKLLGPDFEISPDVKIWRIILPMKFRLSNVLIRANSMQQAFALGCDYVCRMSLRTYKKIPVDLTIRVQFVSEKAIRRMLDLRWANRIKARHKYQLDGREFTFKELHGARLVALGDPKNPEYSIVKYAEAQDLKNILRKHNKVRVSSVETETFRKD